MFPIHDDKGDLTNVVNHWIDITERKQAEEALRKSEKRMKGILESIPSPIIVYNTEGHPLYLNPAFTALFHWSLDELKGRRIQFVPDDQKELTARKIGEVYKTGRVVRYETKRLTKQGDVLDVIVSGAFVAGPDGEPMEMVAILTDITGLKQVEEALRESEVKYRSLVESTDDSIYLLNRKSAYLFVNERHLSRLGMQANECLGRNYGEFHSEAATREFSAILEKVFETGQPTHQQHRNVQNNKYFLRTLSPVRESDGEIRAITVISKDVTERVRSMEALEESEEYHRDLFENSPTALYLQDFTGVEEQVRGLKLAGISDLRSHLRANPEVAFQLSGAVVCSRVNQAAVDLYKAGSKRNLVGSLDRVIIKGDFQHFIDQVVAFTNGEDSWVGEARNYNFQKETIDIVIKKGVINRQANGMSKVLVSINDVTELHKAHHNRERLETQLQNARKMEAIGTLAGGVAHDLNNILGGLVSYPELLLLQLPKDSPLRKSILTIQKSGEKAAAVVQDLLTLARRGVVVTEVVNLSEVIVEYLKSPEQEMLQSYHPGVHIETHLEKGVLNILGSPTHLSKTVMNLVSNAAEAMLMGGNIIVTTENRYIGRPISGYDNVKEGDYVVLTVSDTGTGISPDDIDKIFEPFYTKKKMGRSGTGLGMAVVWGTVKDHSGYIHVESTEGKGTTFTLYFPITRERLPENESHLAIESYSGNGESILIVDDVEEQRKIASGMLKELGYSVVSIPSGEEAVEYLRTHKVALLVLDMIMDPGMDGLDTYRKIIEIHPEQKAIIASGFSETGRAKELQGLGAGAYIRKPFLLEKIGLAVKEELEK
jgi:PAS domain S-box-containing protein